RIARTIDDVDLAVVPVDVQEGARERHPPLVLVVVPVCGGRAGFDRPEPVRLPRLEEQRLRERGLPDPTVPDDGDVVDLPRLGDCWHGARPPEIVGLGRTNSTVNRAIGPAGGAVRTRARPARATRPGGP